MFYSPFAIAKWPITLRNLADNSQQDIRNAAKLFRLWVYNQVTMASRKGKCKTYILDNKHLCVSYPRWCYLSSYVY